MKSIVFFPILMLPILLFGQVVNHFDNIDSKWNVAKTYPAANQQNPGFVATTTIVYGFQGDTLINSETWFKLFSTKDSLFENNLMYQGLTRVENNSDRALSHLADLSTSFRIISSSCLSDQLLAISVLQIPLRNEHPCRRLDTSRYQGVLGTYPR